MKYIDADKLITEIEQLKETNKVSTMKVSEYVQGGIYGFDLAIEKIVTIITSHPQEQPKVDLEKEYIEFVVEDPVYSKLVNGIVGKAIARHFYELGRARKEEGK